MQKGKKQITIKKRESEKGYVEDMQEAQHEEKEKVLYKKEELVIKSFQIPKSLISQMKAYIYKKRIEGDVYYTQKQLAKDAFEKLFRES